MESRRDVLLAFGLILVVVAITLIPYLIAQRMVGSGEVFSGFLINPQDGFTYLAKMRQGASGSWLFKLPYSAEPGAGVLLYLYHLFLGHVARWIAAPLLLVYHGARILAATAMFATAYFFYGKLLGNRREKWAAFLLTLLGAGLGWLGIPFGVMASDLMIPESIPFASAFTNAHFPLAAAALLAGTLAVADDSMTLRDRLLIAVPCALTLGAVMPFALGMQILVLGLWFLVERIVAGMGCARAWWLAQRRRVVAFLGLSLAGAPWLIYGLCISRAHPVISQWMEQNITPSPPPWEYAVGYGLVLLLAIVGGATRAVLRSAIGRLLVVWAGVNAVLLYAPFSLQRRLAIGLFFPLAGLAAMGLIRLTERRLRLRSAMLLVIILSLPSNLITAGAGLYSVSKGEPALILAEDELRAFEWLGANLPPDALVLAGADSGNRIPAYADVRVIYGHPFETPKSEEEKAFVEALYTWNGETTAALAMLTERGVDYVFYGERERELGEATWLEGLQLVHRTGAYEIYKVLTE